MYVMGTDRKPWSTLETRALITLRDEMKPKFQTMKRNRTLWVELSDKLRKHFGHERTAAQCAVRWKNIIAGYKDSREGLRAAAPDPRVCAFFKEVEAVLGDPPLSLPPGTGGPSLLPHTQPQDLLRVSDVPGVSPDESVASAAAAVAASVVPAGYTNMPGIRTHRRGSELATVLAAVAELRAVVTVQGQALERIEKVLMDKERRTDGVESVGARAAVTAYDVGDGDGDGDGNGDGDGAVLLDVGHVEPVAGEAVVSVHGEDDRPDVEEASGDVGEDGRAKGDEDGERALKKARLGHRAEGEGTFAVA